MVKRGLIVGILVLSIVLILPTIFGALTSSNQGNIEVNLTKIENLDPANVNSSLNYTITINMSFDNVTTNVSNLTLIEEYPPQVIFTSSEPAPLAGTNNTFILGNFTFNTSVVVNITVFVNNISNGTVINNTANITYQNSSGVQLNLSVTEGTTVITQPVRLSNITVVKNDNPDPVNRNGQLNYTIEVNSTGNTTAFNVTVNDTFPAEVVFDSSQPAPLSGTNNTFILGNLTVGTSFLINITVNVTANSSLVNGTVITNTVTASFQNASSQVLQNVTDVETTTVLAPIFNLSNISVTKTDDVDPVSAGGQLNYEITVTSTGNGTAFNVTVTDTYPPEVVFDNSTPNPLSGTNNTFIVGNLTNGSTFTINVTVNVSSSATDASVISNNVSVSFQNETSQVLQNETTTASTTISNPPPSGGGGGSSGGGGGGGGGVVMPITMVEDTLTKSMRRLQRIYFMVNNVQHQITILNIYTDKVLIRVESTPQDFTLVRGDVQEVDVNNDNVNDVRITVVDIAYGRTTLTVETLEECFESWSCGDWSDCLAGIQTRECVDQRACGTTALKPYTSQTCDGESVPIIEPEPVAEEPEQFAPLPRWPARPKLQWNVQTLFYGLGALALIGLIGYWYFQRKTKKPAHHKK